TPTAGEISLPDLEPGTYDIVLFDEAEVVARMKEAVTIVAPAPPPSINVQLAGTFTNLAEPAARSLKAGARIAARGTTLEVMSAGPPQDAVRRVRMNAQIIDVAAPGSWRVPAVIRAGCVFNFDNQSCALGDVALTPGLNLPLADGGRFVI